jgi:hypothetical protein
LAVLVFDSNIDASDPLFVNVDVDLTDAAAAVVDMTDELLLPLIIDGRF